MNSTMEPISRDRYQVLRLIKLGYSIPAVAEELGITFGSARTHARNLQRLGLVQGNGKGQPMTVTVDLRTVRRER